MSGGVLSTSKSRASFSPKSEPSDAVRFSTKRWKDRYSTRLVYNNFPWPNASVVQRESVEQKAKAVLAARERHLPPRGLGSLADIYDPISMPADLFRAHAELDRAVEKCYRAAPFHSDRERVEFLFSLYEKLTAPLLPVTPRPRGRRAKTTATNPSRACPRTPPLPTQNLPQKP